MATTSHRRTPGRTVALRRAYQLMRAHFGHLHWWPGETPFEVCVGAILTQNTSWSNVERAIVNLKAARVLVEEYDGDLGRLFAGETAAVRERLLAINGVGPETADSMLLYAGGHHSFVIDAYTKRIFHRHGWSGPNAGYEDLQRLCESALDHKPRRERLDHWQDYHAQLVNVGKEYCRTRQPRCADCPLKPLLPRPA